MIFIYERKLYFHFKVVKKIYIYKISQFVGYVSYFILILFHSFSTRFEYLPTIFSFAE